MTIGGPIIQSEGFCNCTNGTGTAVCFDGLGAAEGLEALPAVDILFAAAWLPFRVVCVFLIGPWVLSFTVVVINWMGIAIPTLLFNRKTKRTKTLPSSVWTIHGKKYDLSSFSAKHPGGAWALELGRNRDCTGLFESYHHFADRNRLTKTLACYEIKEADSNQKPVEYPDGADNTTGLVFNDPFHEDVKNMVRKHFEGKSCKMKPWWAVLQISLICLEAYFGYMFFQGSNAALVVLPILGWLLTCNVSHDGSHFAVSKKPWINSLASYAAMPMTYASTSWHIQHVVQHHVYTNDEDDVDLYHFLPLVRVSRATQWASRFQLQLMTFMLVLPTAVGHLMFVVPMDLLTGQIDAMTGTQRYDQCNNLEDFVVRNRKHLIFELAICLSWGAMAFYTFGFLEGGRRLTISWGISSYLFMIITQGAHLQEECMVGKEDKSWAKRQARTSLNFKSDSVLWLFLTGGLNLQSLHHVAPAVGSSHLIDLWPEYRKICEKHGVVLKEVKNVSEFFRGFLSWIRKLSEQDQLDCTAKKVE
jgi:fatty acid desaturase